MQLKHSLALEMKVEKHKDLNRRIACQTATLNKIKESNELSKLLLTL
jgi:hypothetical protein